MVMDVGAPLLQSASKQKHPLRVNSQGSKNRGILLSESCGHSYPPGAASASANLLGVIGRSHLQPGPKTKHLCKEEAS